MEFDGNKLKVIIPYLSELNEALDMIETVRKNHPDLLQQIEVIVKDPSISD